LESQDITASSESDDVAVCLLSSWFRKVVIAEAFKDQMGIGSAPVDEPVVAGVKLIMTGVERGLVGARSRGQPTR